VRFLRGAFAALLARMAALSCFTMGPLRLAADAASQDIRAASRASYEVPSAFAVNNSLSALIVPLIWGKARIDLLVELVDDFDGRALWRAHAVPAAHLVACDKLAQEQSRSEHCWKTVSGPLADVTRRLRTIA
jgi:hypothetical protein